jgi:hypothetical protein
MKYNSRVSTLTGTEGRVHFAELLYDHGGFVFGEEAGDAVGDAAGGGTVDYYLA